jgi:putative ABC transport system substrate-binding protein
MIARREFITLVGGTAMVWPVGARAQQGERVRRIGVPLTLAESDPEVKASLTAFQEGLQQLGWAQGRNVWIVAVHRQLSMRPDAQGNEAEGRLN